MVPPSDLQLRLIRIIIIIYGSFGGSTAVRLPVVEKYTFGGCGVLSFFFFGLEFSKKLCHPNEIGAVVICGIILAAEIAQLKRTSKQKTEYRLNNEQKAELLSSLLLLLGIIKMCDTP